MSDARTLWTGMRDATTRLVVRWSDHPVARLRGIEISVEELRAQGWRKRFYIYVKPGELFDLSDALLKAVTQFERGPRA